MVYEIWKPLLLTNFKTYLEVTGEKAVRIAKAAEKISKETGVCIVVAPQHVDLPLVARAVEIPVFAQHIDVNPPGPYTGSITAEAVKVAGASGTMLNHAEKRVTLSDLEKAIQRARVCSLYTAVCADTPRMAAAISLLNPDILVVEPPELIGTWKAVSRVKPEVLTLSLKLVRKFNKRVFLVCGAGIKTREDVKAAVKLGLDGVGSTTGIVKSPDPVKSLKNMAEELAKGFKC